jgi:hypothetical protein
MQLSIESTRSSEGRVESIQPVGGSNDDDAIPSGSFLQLPHLIQMRHSYLTRDVFSPTIQSISGVGFA